MLSMAVAVTRLFRPPLTSLKVRQRRIRKVVIGLNVSLDDTKSSFHPRVSPAISILSAQP